MTNYEFEAMKLVDIIDKKVKEEFDFSKTIQASELDANALERMLGETLEIANAWQAAREMILGTGKMLDQMKDMQAKIDKLYYKSN